jgi:hypoxanthine phosphoribosyltransferase
MDSDKLTCQTKIKEAIYDLPVNPDWKLIMTKKEIDLCNASIAFELNQKFKNEKVIVVCILKGAVYFHVDLTRLLAFEHSQYFIEASSYHNAQTQSEQVEILSKIIPSKFAGRKVILLDELYDNGTTINNIKNKIIELAGVKPEDIFTCTIFKKNKKTNNHPPDFYGIVVPNVWLVGYGLDDMQEKRNWDTLWAVPKADGIEPTADDQLFTNEEFYGGIREQMMKMY